MKKVLCFVLAFAMILSLAACGASAEWTREGTFLDENSNYLTISKSEDAEHPGWYVGCMIDEGMYGWYIKQSGKVLKGNITPEYMDDQTPFNVTVSEEGEDGVLLTLENGKKYSFSPYEIPTANIVVTVNTRGMGEVAYAKEGEELVFDDEHPYQSAYIGLLEPEVYTIAVRPEEGYKFWKWTKDGEDFSFEEQLHFELSESAEYLAIFGKKGSDETHVDLTNVKVLGELLGLPEYASASGNGKYIYVFEQDWTYYRATAGISDDVSDAVMALDFDDPEYASKLRTLIGDLPVETIENVSERELKGEQLEALIGKKGKELTDAGWSLWGCNYDDMIFSMNYDCFSYEVKFEGDVTRSEDIDPSVIADLTVREVVCTGLGDATGM